MGLARKLPLLALVALCLGGCQRSVGPLTPVSGKVVYRGTQVRGGLIVFTPDATRGQTGPIAHAEIREDGTFTLVTDKAAGAPAGWYRVTVATHASVAAPGHWATAPLPDRYRDPELSLLACEVKADRANQLDFNLD